MKRIATILLCAGLLSALQLHAQSTSATMFFLDNYVYGYRINPAAQNNGDTKGFFGLGVDNIYVSGHSNLGVTNLVFQKDGGLVTGLHESVPANEFLNGLKDLNKANINLNENILSLGFRKEDFLGNFEVNLRSDTYGFVPKSVFALLKKGTEDEKYAIDDLHLRSSNYLEFAFGVSRKLENLTIGGRLKLLFGFYQVGADLDKVGVVSRGGQMDVNGKGEIFLAQDMFKMDDDFELGDFKGLRPIGVGCALDLGATYTLDKWYFSLGLLDLGGLAWKKTTVGTINYSGTIQGDTEFDMDEFADIRNIEKPGFTFCPQSPVINGGARYTVSDIFSAGASVSARLSRLSAFAEGRLGATLSPAKFFSIAASAGVSNYGPCFGAAMSLNFPVVNFFVGTDGIVARFTPQYVPIKPLNTTVNAGLAIAF